MQVESLLAFECGMLMYATALLGKVIIGEQHLPKDKKIIKSAQDVGGQAGTPKK